MRRNAGISPCGKYRHWLTREWGGRGEAARWAVFTGLNPSTADDKVDDPTLKKMFGYAQRFSCNALLLINIADYRATNPQDMAAQGFAAKSLDMTGAVRAALAVVATSFRMRPMGPVIACWGHPPKAVQPLAGEMFDILKGAALLPRLQSFGVTAHGWPSHPLYLSKGAALLPYPLPGAALPAGMAWRG